MATKNEKAPTLEDIRVTLEKSREHIDTMWFQGEWFTYVERGSDEEMVGSDVPKGAQVKNVCLAGSVLYSLDYLDEQWTDRATVKPVIEVLFDNLPAQSKAMKQFRAQQADRARYTNGDNEAALYADKVEAIITWNDQAGRRKQEVLDLFDRTIKDVVARTTPTIQEVPTL